MYSGNSSNGDQGGGREEPQVLVLPSKADTKLLTQPATMIGLLDRVAQNMASIDERFGFRPVTCYGFGRCALDGASSRGMSSYGRVERYHLVSSLLEPGGTVLAKLKKVGMENQVGLLCVPRTRAHLSIPTTPAAVTSTATSTATSAAIGTTSQAQVRNNDDDKIQGKETERAGLLGTCHQEYLSTLDTVGTFLFYLAAPTSVSSQPEILRELFLKDGIPRDLTVACLDWIPLDDGSSFSSSSSSSSTSSPFSFSSVYGGGGGGGGSSGDSSTTGGSRNRGGTGRGGGGGGYTRFMLLSRLRFFATESYRQFLHLHLLSYQKQISAFQLGVCVQVALEEITKASSWGMYVVNILPFVEPSEFMAGPGFGPTTFGSGPNSGSGSSQGEELLVPESAMVVPAALGRTLRTMLGFGLYRDGEDRKEWDEPWVSLVPPVKRACAYPVNLLSLGGVGGDGSSRNNTANNGDDDMSGLENYGIDNGQEGPGVDDINPIGQNHLANDTNNNTHLHSGLGVDNDGQDHLDDNMNSHHHLDGVSGLDPHEYDLVDKGFPGILTNRDHNNDKIDTAGASSKSEFKPRTLSSSSSALSSLSSLELKLKLESESEQGNYVMADTDVEEEVGAGGGAGVGTYINSDTDVYVHVDPTAGNHVNADTETDPDADTDAHVNSNADLNPDDDSEADAGADNRTDRKPSLDLGTLEFTHLSNFDHHTPTNSSSGSSSSSSPSPSLSPPRGRPRPHGYFRPHPRPRPHLRSGSRYRVPAAVIPAKRAAGEELVREYDDDDDHYDAAMTAMMAMMAMMAMAMAGVTTMTTTTCATAWAMERIRAKARASTSAGVLTRARERTRERTGGRERERPLTTATAAAAIKTTATMARTTRMPTAARMAT